MAKKEVEITIQRNVRFMNQELSTIFPHRSLEAIKKARQKSNYKASVRRYMDEMEAGPSGQAQNNTAVITEPITQTSIFPDAVQFNDVAMQLPDSRPNNQFVEYMLAQPTPRRSAYQRDRLQAIIVQATVIGKDETLIALSSYLMDILPIKQRSTPTRRENAPQVPSNRRKRRRQEYALTQKNWAKHQGRCIRTIVDGPNQSKLPPKNIMAPYWRAIMENESTTSPAIADMRQSLDDVWNPVTCEEIKQSRLSTSTSPGPDGITARQLKAVPTDILMRIFNLILWCGRFPNQYVAAETIFIPKKEISTDPSDFRPITIPSVIVRQLHNILARRLSASLSLDPRQRAFQHSDGCADNTTLIDLLLRDHHQRFASCYIATLDVSKAFDSVSHPTIFGALASYGVPEGFLEYVKAFYNMSTTRLVGEDWISGSIHPARGVKQGDPLSPVLFNIIIDRLLRTLPDEVGCYIGTHKSNATAFADDLTLFASTPQGLQVLIDDTHAYLTACGMALNTDKCTTISIKGQPKQKRTVIDQDQKFVIAGRQVPALKRSDEWRYLGVNFTAEGRCKYKPHEELQPKLDRITKAPLKPQQRLHALRTVLIPQLYHKVTLGNVMIGSLNKTDRIIRAAVRRWFNLPKDVPIAFFHAPIDQGGLGIQSLRWYAPLLRKQRLNNIQWPYLEDVTSADTFIATELDKADRRLRVDGRSLASKSDINTYWSGKLHNSVDGSGLREAGKHKQAHRWIREPSKLLSGRDFIYCIKLRINALPSRSRTTRGRSEADRTCRAGCQVSETTNHIVQQCHRTHASRIDRHNHVVSYVKRSLDNKGYNTILEPIFNTSEGARKPDLIATLGNRTVVFDAQVVTDGRSLDDAHWRKINYYNTSEMRQLIQGRFGNQDIIYATATLNWRGIWSGASVDHLLAQDILRKTDTALISTRVSIGSIRCFRIFNQTTLVNFRQGIG